MKKIRYAVRQWLRSKVADPTIKLVKQVFRSKDERLLDKLTKSVNETDKRIYRTILENQLSYIRNEEQASRYSNNSAYNVNMREMLPVVVKVLDQVVPVLRSFIGIQPMSGPVALVYLLQYKELDETEDGVRRAHLEVVSRAVEAVSRRLQMGWTLEAQQDFVTKHNIDIEKEMKTAFAYELASEIFTEVFDQLRPETVPTIALNPASDFSLGQQLSVHINKLANEIARDTRRGAGNAVLMSPLLLSLLQEDKSVKFDPAPTVKPFEMGSILFVGMLNKSIKVYSGLIGDTNEVFVAYKGGNGDTDAGFIYSPYLLLMSSGVVIDPLTFQPAVRFMTRAGSHRVDNFESYYKTVRFNLGLE